MNTKHLTIRPATIHDAPIIASALTMALGEEAMKMYCGENCQSVLEELAQMENTQYSYHNALIADVDGIPAGAIIGYDGARLHELREPTLRLIQERTGQTFSHIQDETNPHEYYLDSLGVLPEYRNLGIGSKLLIALRDKLSPKDTNGLVYWSIQKILKQSTFICHSDLNVSNVETSLDIRCGTYKRQIHRNDVKYASFSLLFCFHLS